MKKIFISSLLILLLTSCVRKPEIIQETPVNNDDLFTNIRGDFNGDSKIETAIFEGQGDCMAASGCNCEIKISDNSITSEKIENCIPGTIKNFGDINRDGRDDILVWPSTTQGYWRYPYVMGFINDKWEVLVASSVNTSCEEDISKDIFEIDRNSEPGYINVLSHEEANFSGCGTAKYIRERIKFFVEK